MWRGTRNPKTKLDILPHFGRAFCVDSLGQRLEHNVGTKTYKQHDLIPNVILSGLGSGLVDWKISSGPWTPMALLHLPVLLLFHQGFLLRPQLHQLQDEQGHHHC